MNKPVCLILGAGAGIGGNAAKRFAREGYHACLARRSDKAGMDKLVAEIRAVGGSASGFMLNAVEEGSIEQLVTHIEADVGPIAVAVFNLGAQIGDRGLASTPLKTFELGWRMATFGLFRLAQVMFPYMAQVPPIAQETGAALVWHPMLLGGVFKATGNASPVSVPAKGRWMNDDIARWASRWGVPLAMNPHFPINTLTLMRGACGLLMRQSGDFRRYVDTVFHAVGKQMFFGQDRLDFVRDALAAA